MAPWQIALLVVLIVIVSAVFVNLFVREKKDKQITYKMTTKQLMYVVTLSTLAVVVGFLEIPIGLTGLKFDFSEVIILLSYLLLGFKGTSLVIIFRSVVRFILPAKTSAEAEIMIKFIGEVIAIIASFLITSTYVLSKKIFKIQEKPLLIAVPTEVKKPTLKFQIVNAILSSVILTVGITIFHVLFTMPIYTSYLFNKGKYHLIIFTYLKDPNYGDSLINVLKYIIVSFGLLNIIKGVLSSVIFLILKPRIEEAIS